MPRTTPPDFMLERPGYTALRRGRVSEPGQIYLLTTVARERRAVFSDPRSARCAAACFGNQRLLGSNRMLAWVLMPDHAHLLLELGAGESLPQSVSRLKSATARVVNGQRGARQPVWERGYHDHALRREEDLESIARYVIENPVRAGLVGRVEEYPYWYSVWG